MPPFVLTKGEIAVDRPNPMFKDRVPEAAASQLGVVLAWLAECQLATLEDLEGRKSTSKSELARHRDICQKAVFHCADLAVPPRGLLGRDCGRLAEAMAALQENP